MPAFFGKWLSFLCHFCSSSTCDILTCDIWKTKPRISYDLCRNPSQLPKTVPSHTFHHVICNRTQSDSISSRMCCICCKSCLAGGTGFASMQPPLHNFLLRSDIGIQPTQWYCPHAFVDYDNCRHGRRCN